jgi:hypothetical protein
MKLSCWLISLLIALPSVCLANLTDFYLVQFHRQLADLALEGYDLRITLNHRTGCSLLCTELTTIMLDEPQLNQIRRDLVGVLHCSGRCLPE